MKLRAPRRYNRLLEDPESREAIVEYFFVHPSPFVWTPSIRVLPAKKASPCPDKRKTTRTCQCYQIADDWGASALLPFIPCHLSSTAARTQMKVAIANTPFSRIKVKEGRPVRQSPITAASRLTACSPFSRHAHPGRTLSATAAVER